MSFCFLNAEHGVKIYGPYLTLNQEAGLKTPQPMGTSVLSVTRTQSPACGCGLPITLSTAPLYTIGCPFRKTAVLPLLRTTLGASATKSAKQQLVRKGRTNAYADDSVVLQTNKTCSFLAKRVRSDYCKSNLLKMKQKVFSLRSVYAVGLHTGSM